MRFSSFQKILKSLITCYEPEVILKIFLNFDEFEPYDSYKKNSYKKQCMHFIDYYSTVEECDSAD